MRRKSQRRLLLLVIFLACGVVGYAVLLRWEEHVHWQADRIQQTVSTRQRPQLETHDHAESDSRGVQELEFSDTQFLQAKWARLLDDVWESIGYETELGELLSARREAGDSTLCVATESLALAKEKLFSRTDELLADSSLEGASAEALNDLFRRADFRVAGKYLSAYRSLLKLAVDEMRSGMICSNDERRVELGLVHLASLLSISASFSTEVTLGAHKSYLGVALRVLCEYFSIGDSPALPIATAFTTSPSPLDWEESVFDALWGEVVTKDLRLFESVSESGVLALRDSNSPTTSRVWTVIQSFPGGRYVKLFELQQYIDYVDSDPARFLRMNDYGSLMNEREDVFGSSSRFCTPVARNRERVLFHVLAYEWDRRRLQDLIRLGLAIELYHEKNGEYPTDLSYVDAEFCRGVPLECFSLTFFDEKYVLRCESVSFSSEFPSWEVSIQ